MNLSPIDHKARLERLMAQLGPSALVVLAQPEAIRNATIEHSYRQDSFLHYLLGFDEPHCALVVLPFRPQGERIHLFLRGKNPEKELWEGIRLGIEGAKATLPINEAYDIGQFWDKLPELLGEAESVHYTFGQSQENDREFIHALVAHKAIWGRRKGAVRLPVFDALEVAGHLRLQKEPQEIERMKAAAFATKAGFSKVFELTRPGMNERDIHGLLLGSFLQAGSEMEAYGAIVAGGANACVLHYRGNNQPLKDGELLLIDAGAQFDYYACDVTRTFPIGKRFSPEQKALYEVVLAAQLAAIGEAKPGSTLNAVHDISVNVLVQGLLDLRLLTGSFEEILVTKSYRRFFPHNTSHWIGLDVHDVGRYHIESKPVNLSAGMYFSVEPGLYVAPDDLQAPQAFRGIGIRIEDDVLITDEGHEVLTAGIPKDIRSLEDRFR